MQINLNAVLYKQKHREIQTCFLSNRLLENKLKELSGLKIPSNFTLGNHTKKKFHLFYKLFFYRQIYTICLLQLQLLFF